MKVEKKGRGKWKDIGSEGNAIRGVRKKKKKNIGIRYGWGEKKREELCTTIYKREKGKRKRGRKVAHLLIYFLAQN